MDFNEYQKLTGRTEPEGTLNERLTNYAFGIAGEGGEVVDIIKKVVFHKHNPENNLVRDDVKGELGDLMWYIARTAEKFGLTLQEVVEYNIEKLMIRYPEGFKPEDSINRNI